jgi:hypothetical protein
MTSRIRSRSPGPIRDANRNLRTGSRGGEERTFPAAGDLVNRESAPAVGAAGVSGAFDPAVGGLRPASGIHAGTGVSRPDQQRREAIESTKSTEYSGERSRGQGGGGLFLFHDAAGTVGPMPIVSTRALPFQFCLLLLFRFFSLIKLVCDD